MRTCFIISLAAHVSLLLFGYFANISTPESSEVEFEFADVAIVDLDDWVAITTPAPIPVEEPEQLSSADVLDREVPAPAIPIPEPVVTKPEIPSNPSISAVAPSAPATPDFTAPSAPAPTLPPRMQAPEVVMPPAPSQPQAPPEPEEAPEVEEAVEVSAPKVSSEAAPEPEPDVVQDDEVQVATRPDDSTEPTQSEEVEQSTAPEHAATKIVTEADEAEERSATVPIQRPSYIASRADSPDEPEGTAAEPEVEQEEVPEDAEDPLGSSVPDQEDIDSLIVQSQLEQVASAEEQYPSTEPLIALPESGAPLPSSVSEGLRSVIRECWNVGALSTAGMRTVLTVGFSLDRNGKLKVETIKLVDAQSESEVAESRAFEAARRAIICGLGKGLELPPESYSSWQNIEMRFDPELMRSK